nr:DBH-like monooxygenase protein 1 [Penaeus vannamei]
MPLDYNSCNSPVIVWSTGGEVSAPRTSFRRPSHPFYKFLFDFFISLQDFQSSMTLNSVTFDGEREPAHVGRPLVPEVGEYAFFLVEAHYDNAPKADSMSVEWGIDVYYTDQLREFESASMFVGNTVNFALVVPPARDHWTTTGHCPAGCLLDGIPETGIKVYQVLLKAHELARGIRVRHFRDDQELPPLALDDFYDSSFQQAVRLEEERTILPSDHITAECTYDSSGRSNTTFSGYGAFDEVCQAVLSYYPRHTLVECTSSTYHSILKEVLGIKQLQNEQNLLAIKLKTSYPDAAPYAPPELECPRMLGQKVQHAGASSSVSAFSCLLLTGPVLLAVLWQ